MDLIEGSKSSMSGSFEPGYVEEGANLRGHGSG